jgi:hypothetical protein
MKKKRKKKNGTSREAATECSLQRKLWVEIGKE